MLFASSLVCRQATPLSLCIHTVHKFLSLPLRYATLAMYTQNSLVLCLSLRYGTLAMYTHSSEVPWAAATLHHSRYIYTKFPGLPTSDATLAMYTCSSHVPWSAARLRHSHFAYTQFGSSLVCHYADIHTCTNIHMNLHLYSHIHSHTDTYTHACTRSHTIELL